MIITNLAQPNPTQPNPTSSMKWNAPYINWLINFFLMQKSLSIKKHRATTTTIKTWVDPTLTLSPARCLRIAPSLFIAFDICRSSLRLVVSLLQTTNSICDLLLVSSYHSLVTGWVHSIQLTSIEYNVRACVRACCCVCFRSLALSRCDNDDGSLHWRFYYFIVIVWCMCVRTHHITSHHIAYRCDMHSDFNKFKRYLHIQIAFNISILRCSCYYIHRHTRFSLSIRHFLHTLQSATIIKKHNSILPRWYECNYVYFYLNVYESVENEKQKTNKQKIHLSKRKLNDT